MDIAKAGTGFQESVAWSYTTQVSMGMSTMLTAPPHTMGRPPAPRAKEGLMILDGKSGMLQGGEEPDRETTRLLETEA